MIAVFFLAAFFLAAPAHAQLYNAGDACTVAGKVYTAEGGAGPSLVCNGTILVVDESVLTGPYARGIGTAAPKAPLHVAGEAIIGPTTGLACDADRTGGIRWSAADLTFEMCDGTEWKKIVATSGVGVPPSAPAGSGYFVISNGTWDGTSAGIGLQGISGANAKCLSDLTTNDWLGKAEAQARGQLTSANVQAFLCTTGDICQSPIALSKYYFAQSGNPTVGGAYLETDAAGGAPNNNQNWSAANYFGGSYQYWSGRGPGTSTAFPNTGSSVGYCTGWNYVSGGQGSNNYATTNATDSGRWNSSLVGGCTGATRRLICMVHPAGGSGADLTPDVFTFTALTNQVLNTVVTSNIVTVAGFDGPLSVYVTGPGSPQLRVNGGAWGNSVNISPGNTLQIRQTTSPAPSTSRAALVTLGTAAVDWVVTTAVGEVPVGNTGLICNAGAAGTVRYNSGGTIMEYCNGTAWATIGGAMPAGADREIQFNNAGALGASSTFKLMSDGDLLLTGTYTGTASVPVSGAGTRMFFDTQKGAFRAGAVDGTQWDNANIGNYSVAMGYSAKAPGLGTVAIGRYTETGTCEGGVAIGDSVTASNCGAVALGANNSATGGWTFATGYGASAQQQYASAIGYGVTAMADSSHVLGRGLVASGISSFAIGREAVAGNRVNNSGFGDHSMAIGLGDSSGADSATWPRVTGDSSLGIFMGDQANANITASNVMAVLGGSVVIDPDTTSSTTATAKAPLQVVGEVIVGTTTGLACDADRKGGLRWSDALGTIEMCDGTDWKQIASATCDNAPAFFPFTAQTGLGVSTLVTSNIATITGMDAGCTATVSVSGVNGSPEYRVCSTSDCSSVTQDWTAANNTIDMQGKYLQLRATTSASAGTEFTITASVGPVSSDWSITTLPADCSLSPVGTVCADGTVYAGTSPASSTPMYVTRCDGGRVWGGSSCGGSRLSTAWNNGNSSGYVDTSLTNCGAAPCAGTADGQANTATLAATDSDSGVGGTQPHAAAVYCDGLSLHGHTDWYLPSLPELGVIVLANNPDLTNGTGDDNTLGDFAMTTYYWSSSESSSTHAWFERPSDGNQYNVNKYNGYAVRCARR